MIQITFFTEIESEKEAADIVARVLSRIEQQVSSWAVVSNEPYWKIEGWYRTTVDLLTRRVVERKDADSLLSAIADYWDWDEVGGTADASSDRMGSRFADEKIRFATAWFEDLETCQ